MTQLEIDSLPVYGGTDPWPKPLGVIIVKVTYCFHWCVSCAKPIDGYEGIVFRERGESLWRCTKAYHPACLTDVPYATLLARLSNPLGPSPHESF